MRISTLPMLRCFCGGKLKCQDPAPEIRTGSIACELCPARFPIIAGVAIVVSDVHAYLMEHAAGISQFAQDEEIPEDYRAEYLQILRESEGYLASDDLESERVNALYYLNHYLNSKDFGDWWKPAHGSYSPLLDQLIREHWDGNPIRRLPQLMPSKWEHPPQVIELGCSVGGVYPIIRDHLQTGSYLGTDTSFTSVAWARAIGFGIEAPEKISIPSDLIEGPFSKDIPIRISSPPTGPSGFAADFIVADLTQPPVTRNDWDCCLALNVMDMLDRPALLPEIQNILLKTGGLSIQSSPYVWPDSASESLLNSFKNIINPDSADLVEMLYAQAGFSITESFRHSPWLFYKNSRQLEIYSSHIFSAEKRQ